MGNDKLCMRSIVLDNRNSRRYWISTLIMLLTVHSAFLRAIFSLIHFFPFLHSSLCISSILSRLLSHFFFFPPVPPQGSSPLSFGYTSLYIVSLLHYFENFSSPIITSPQVIIAKYDAIFGQWERENFYNHLSNYTNSLYNNRC